MNMEFPEDLPFNNEKDLKEAVRQKNACFGLGHLVDGLTIASNKNKYFFFWSYLGFFIDLLITLFFVLKYQLYWLLICLPIYFFFGFLVRALAKRISLAVILTIIALLLFDNVMWLSCILICLSCLIFSAKIYVNKIYKYFKDFILNDAEAFLALWYEGRISVNTNDGKIYYYNPVSKETRCLN